MQRVIGFVRRFIAATRGVAAIEFALVAPIMAGALIMIVDVGVMTVERTDMQSAVRSGAQYFMNGGRDLDQAKEIVLSAWSSRPETGVVVADRFCMCGDEVHDCNTLCADESIPESYGRLAAAATIVGLLTESAHSANQIVRIR